MQNKFLALIEKHEIFIEKYKTVFSVVGYLKLFFVLLFGVSIYFTFSEAFPTELILASALEFALLIALWVYHDRLNKKINYSGGIIAINKQHLDRISGKWPAFEDIGEEFIDIEHAYACDLDIVGKKSFFQFLNITNTWHGRQAFANDLLSPAYSNQEIPQRQKAIAELSEDISFANHMQYHLSKIGVDDSTQKLVNELKDKKIFIKNKAIKFLLTYLPWLTLILIAAVSLFQLNDLYLTATTLVLVQAVIWLIGAPKMQTFLGAMNHLPYNVSIYSTVINILNERNFVSQRLLEIQGELGTAAQAIKELGKISDRINTRNNGIFYFILNAFLLWDYQCAFKLQDWKAKYAHLAEKWFLSLGEFESLLCFSHLPNVCGHTCLPVIAEKKKSFEIKEAGHPLLPDEIRVNNDLSCHNNIFIISGSNMSGKTTFLRTIGINLVLAHTGSYVCAKQMTFSPTGIITSMRVADDLNEGVSTFYAELRRVKSIIELAEKDSDMVFLIDEIFKGTNSVDRLTGAKTIIAKLDEFNVTGMITTHDLELCRLAKQHPRIKNFSFSEYYRNNKICFDYKIKPGESTTTNAKYLMEMVGIL